MMNKTFIIGMIAVSLIFTAASCNGKKDVDGTDVTSKAAKSSGKESPASYFEYKATNDKTGIVIVKYTKNDNGKPRKDSKIVIPSTIEGLPVKEIAGKAFAGYPVAAPDEDCVIFYIKEIVIPASVEYLDNEAFRDLLNLTKITYLGTDLKFESHNFDKCPSLTTIEGIDAFNPIIRNVYNLSFGDSKKLPLATRTKLEERGFTLN